MKTKLTQWKLRRLGPRAVRVLERHKDKADSLAAFEAPLTEANAKYKESYDRLRVLEASRATELAEGKKTVQELYKKMRGWVSIVAMNGQISGFDAGSYGDNPGVMDDVIHDAEALIELVTDHAESVPSSDALLAELSQALQIATTEWTEAESLGQEYQEIVKQNRVNANNLHDILVAFRSTLASVIGRADPDYQRLRSSKIDRTVLEEGEEEDLPENLIPETPIFEESGDDDAPANNPEPEAEAG